jgi:hypothetical protein
MPGFNFAKRDETDAAHVKAQVEKCDNAGLLLLWARMVAHSKSS